MKRQAETVRIIIIIIDRIFPNMHKRKVQLD